MKKLVGLFLLLAALLTGLTVFATEAVPESESAHWGVRTDTLTFRFFLQKSGFFPAAESTFFLCDKNGALLQTVKLDVQNSSDYADLVCTVPHFYTGETFYLIPIDGMKVISWCGVEYIKHAPLKIDTYHFIDENGNTVVGNYFELALAPEYLNSEYSANVESFINSSGLDSRTSYLIWVSKKDFTVNVFQGSLGAWDHINSFPCSIGKPSTPTITGVFEYFAYQTMWKYDKYYCGPIMRFAPKGYAMHSTLIRYDGTPYDGRLGMKISEGCVRMAPENIQWLANSMPLYTRVYITE